MYFGLVAALTAWYNKNEAFKDRNNGTYISHLQCEIEEQKRPLFHTED